MKKVKTPEPSRRPTTPSPLTIRPLPDAAIVVLVLLFVALVPVILAAILVNQ